MNRAAEGTDQRLRIANGTDFKIICAEVVKGGARQRSVHSSSHGVPHAVVVHIVRDAHDLVRWLVGMV